MIVTKSLVDWMVEEGHCEPEGSEHYYEHNAAQLLAEGTLTPKLYRRLCKGEKAMSKVADPEKLFAGRIRVKDASEQFSEQRYELKHAKTGLPIINPVTGEECTTMSDGAKARAGILFKHLANKSGIVNPLTEFEREMLNGMTEQLEWCGKIGSEHYDSIGGHKNVKALIDDATSGGLEITPIEFDSDVITFPLLNGELFPLVDLQPVPRGRRIEGASIGNPTMTWGGGDNAEISLFSTTSLVAAIDTTIFAIDGAIEIGRDFLSDSPVEVGSVLTKCIGERLGAELDKVIASGNGTTQPEGIFVASGTGTASPDNTTTGPPTLADYFDLLFGIAKQYRNAGMRPVFISNDTSYARSRAIKIDTASPSTDQRSVLDPMMSNFGGAVANSYQTLGWPHKVQNDLANGTAGICAMAKYRMYRRLGLDIRFETGGQTLARKNLALLVFRARYGGRLMDANACCKWANGQS